MTRRSALVQYWANVDYIVWVLIIGIQNRGVFTQEFLTMLDPRSASVCDAGLTWIQHGFSSWVPHRDPLTWIKVQSGLTDGDEHVDHQQQKSRHQGGHGRTPRHVCGAERELLIPGDPTIPAQVQSEMRVFLGGGDEAALTSWVLDGFICCGS